MARKLAVVLLAVAMILSYVGTAAAAQFSDVAGYKHEAAIGRLASLGLLAGYPDGTFKPDQTITRAEFAKVIVIALGLKEAAEVMTGVPTAFSDVAATHWATGYINVAASQGIVNGYPDGTFKPDAQVTYAEALAMILRALGYTQDVLKNVVWPVTYVAKAAQLGITSGVTFSANVPATRGDVAAFVDKALTVPKVVQVGFGDQARYVVSGTDPNVPKETLLENNIGCETKSGTVTAVDAAAKKVTVGASVYELADAYTLIGAGTLADLVDNEVKVYLLGGKALVVEVTKQSVVAGALTGLWKDSAGTQKATAAGEVKYVTIGGKIYELGTFEAGLNGSGLSTDTDPSKAQAKRDSVLGKLIAFRDGKISMTARAVVGSDGKLTKLEVTAVDVPNARIDADPVKNTDTTQPDLLATVTVKGEDATTLGATKITKETAVVLNGAAVAWDALKKNDIVDVTRKYEFDATNAVVPAASFLKIDATRNVVTAKATGKYRLVTGETAYYEMDLELPDGTVKTYRVSGSPTIADGLSVADIQTPKGYNVAFALNKAGELRKTVTAPDLTPVVLVKAYTQVAGDYDIVTVDEKGVTKTYQVHENPIDTPVVPLSTAVGKIGQLTIATATGRVTGWSDLTPVSGGGTVVALDVANGIVTVDVGGTLRASDKAFYAAYEGDVPAIGKKFIGLGGLAVGDKVAVKLDANNKVVAVVKDTVAPTVASCTGSGTSITVVFSEPVDKTTAETLGNYSYDADGPGAGAAVAPTAAALQADGKTVVLTVGTAVTAGTSTLAVSGVKDLAGNVMAAVTKTVQAP